MVLTTSVGLDHNEDRGTRLVCVIGRPGSGKSTILKLARQIIESEKPTTRVATVSDYRYFADIFSTKFHEGKKYQKCSDGGYVVLIDSVYREALQDSCNRVLKARPNADIAFLEFSRSNYCTSLQFLGDYGCKPDLIIYIRTSFATCMRRNKMRRSDEGGHYVSKEEMIKTFAHDDIATLIARIATPVIELRNERDGIDFAVRVAKSLVRRVLAQVEGQ